MSVALAKTSSKNKGATPEGERVTVAFLQVTIGLVTSFTEMGHVVNALPRMLVAWIVAVLDPMSAHPKVDGVTLALLWSHSGPPTTIVAFVLTRVTETRPELFKAS